MLFAPKGPLLTVNSALTRPLVSAATSGSIRVGGTDLARESDLPGYRRRHIGLVFQLHDLLPQLSAIQNAEVGIFGTGLTGRQRRARALLAAVGLDGHGGQAADQAVRG